MMQWSRAKGVKILIRVGVVSLLLNSFVTKEREKEQGLVKISEIKYYNVKKYIFHMCKMSIQVKPV